MTTAVGRAWELVWDGPPPPNMNGSDSPYRRRASRKLWRANAVALAVAAEIPTREIVRYRISGTVLRRNLGVADHDGDVSRFKSVIDGLVAGLYLPDDNRRYAEWGEITEAHGKPGFILRIEELPSDAAISTLAHRRYARDDALSPLELARRAAAHRRRPAPAPRRQAAPGRPAAVRARGVRARRARGDHD